MAAIKQRLEKLEAVVKTQTISCVIIRIIVEPDGTISDAIRRNANGEYVSVSDEDLAEIVAEDQLIRTVK